MIKRIIFLFLLSFLGISLSGYAQDSVRDDGKDLVISGKVLSATDNSPLPGVAVVVKGTSIGGITDINGKYSISVPAGGGTLVFTFIGYETKEVAINGQTVIDEILREQTDVLNEVVVTALGVSRKKQALGYAVSSVGGDQVSEAKDANFLNSLSGKVAGMNVKYSGTMGGSTNVVIRGYTSITGNNQALFVVDGTPISNSTPNTSGQSTGRGGYDYGNAAMDVNPDDIESIDVLKGAAATALYGSRGSNGVVLITTKKGKRDKDGYMGITFNSSVTFEKVDASTLPVYQKKYGAGYGPYYDTDDKYFLETGFANGSFTSGNERATPFTEDASYGAKFDPSLNVYQWNSLYKELDTYGKATPWVAGANDPNTIFETGSTLVNSLTLESGDAKSNYRLGLTKYSQEGILPNSSLMRNTLFFSASRDVSDKLTVSAVVNYVNTKGKGRQGTGYDGRNIFQSFRQWYQTNVDIQEQKEAYMNTKKNITWNTKSTTDLRPQYMDNPYWTLYENFQTDERDRYFGNISANYKVTDWINVLGRITYDTYNELQEERINVSSNDVSMYRRYQRSVAEYNYDLLINFQKELNEDFNIDGNLGYNLRTQNWDRNTATTNGGIITPSLYSFSNTASSMDAPSEYNATKKVEGFFGRASLGYKEFAYLDLTYRADRSSALPEKNNTYMYPSISASIVFSNLIEKPWLSFGKLRVNYAEVGNDTSPYNTLNTYNLVTPFSGRALASNASRLRNTELKEERQKSYEIGLEMNFWQNRLAIDISYYNTRTEDLLTPVDISRSSGVISKWLNAGTTQNQGVELSLSGTPLKINDFKWDVTINWAKNVNKVVSLTEGIDNLQLGGLQGGVTINAAPGQPFGTIRGRDFVYLDGKKVVKSNGAYKRSSESNKIIGDINPDWKGGIQNKFSYKNLSLSFLIDIQSGGDVFSLDTWYGYATGIYDVTAENNELGNPVRDPVANGGGRILPGVKEDGTPNDIRADFSKYNHAFGYSKAPHAMHVYDASFVKLRELVISYVLPGNIVDKLPFSFISASIIGRNLWIISKNVPYADPEAGLGAGNIQGYQSGAPPAVRQIGGSIKLKF